MSIPRTPDELLDRAARAESTGQPRLAALYFKRAEEITEQDRRAALGPLERVFEDYAKAFRAIGSAYRSAFGYTDKEAKPQ